MMDRRDFIRLAGLGVGGLGLAPGSADALATGPGPVAPRGRGAGHAGGAGVAQSATLTADTKAVAFEGRTVTAWAFNDSLPGPPLRFRRGDRADILLRNELPESTIVHWHGLDVPEDADGHPRLAIAPGETYRYRFDVVDRAGMYWYHPHTHGRTGAQTYAGLAGLILVGDEEEDSLPLPAPEDEVTLILQDRRVETGGSPFEHRPAMGPDMMIGHLGDAGFANGERDAEVEVRRGLVRLRVLNACNARLLDLGLSTGDPMTLIGSDGGLLERPSSSRRIMIGTGERLDLLVDFSGHPAGTRITLRSFPFEISGMMSPGNMGRGGRGRGMGGMQFAGLPQGAAMDMVHFVVGDERGSDPGPLPARIASLPAPIDGEVARRRDFRFDSGMMQHLINGRSFAMERVDHEIRLGTTEVWHLVNDSGFAHPVHVHAGQFRVLSRTGGRGEVMPWEGGLKDTVLVLPQERVEIAVRFDRYPGLFLMHCHNLEHEDAGMMMNFRVVE